VVRLKGGDPFVFGRGGEEVLALVEAGLPFEVVPGITSAIAAPAYAGIPVTHRGISTSVTIVTGSEAPGKDDPSVDWKRVLQPKGTAVILMGWENLKQITTGLIASGTPPETPIALVYWGTEPYQKAVSGTLADIIEIATAAGISNPVVAIVGEVVKLRERLRWFDNRPLFGKRVLVTRTRSQASVLSDLLSREGAQPIEIPTIEIQPVEDFCEVDGELAGLAGYNWVVFTSVNAIDIVFERLSAGGRDARAFGPAKIAAIGSSSADALRAKGIVADAVADDAASEGIVGTLVAMGIAGAKILFPRAEKSRDIISRGLTSAGASVKEVVIYRNVRPADAAERLNRAMEAPLDVVTFASSSSVRNLVDLLGGDITKLGAPLVACIGPVTAAAARDLGLRVDIVGKDQTIRGLVDAIRQHFVEAEAARNG